MAATLQQVIGRLMAAWDGRGFAVLPPCGLEVPLGFQHPEAFFRLLDPEPWNAAFLQPIDRPADSRAGRHPFRTARHLQFQVLWQDPPPTAPRDAFAETLAVLGLDPADHDLRFVDQVLEVKALGVVGRGWRVELDGLGVGRVTFLEQLGGLPLRRRTAELGFGVERLGMALAESESVFTVPWRREASGTATGARRPAKRRETEEELYRYAVGVANVGHLRQIVDGLDREARRCLDAGLPRAAYELAIRALPALDRLDTRGDLTPREREQWLDQVRSLVEDAATQYVARAEPLLDVDEPTVSAAAAEPPDEPSPTDAGPAATAAADVDPSRAAGGEGAEPGGSGDAASAAVRGDEPAETPTKKTPDPADARPKKSPRRRRKRKQRDG
ncbi:MAG: glycine--tRNA ligase subunit alpha [Acidobacteriota bacterium]